MSWVFFQCITRNFSLDHDFFVFCLVFMFQGLMWKLPNKTLWPVLCKTADNCNGPFWPENLWDALLWLSWNCSSLLHPKMSTSALIEVGALLCGREFTFMIELSRVLPALHHIPAVFSLPTLELVFLFNSFRAVFWQERRIISLFAYLVFLGAGGYQSKQPEVCFHSVIAQPSMTPVSSYWYTLTLHTCDM